MIKYNGKLKKQMLFQIFLFQKNLLKFTFKNVKTVLFRYSLGALSTDQLF